MHLPIIGSVYVNENRIFNSVVIPVNSDLGKHVKKLHFGPAGKPVGFKGRVEDVPKALSEMGLDALEFNKFEILTSKKSKLRK